MNTVVNKLLNEVVVRLVRTFGNILPKCNIVVLRGFPSYEDNLLAIYESIAAREIGKIVWIVDDPTVVPPILLLKNTKLVKYRSFQDLLYSMISRYVFITHGHFLTSPLRGQVFVNLWHGIPFKSIGVSQGMAKRNDTITVATSILTQQIFSQVFGINKEKVVITGQARTDRMLAVNRGEIISNLFGSYGVNKKLLVWLPTYRKSKSSHDGQYFGSVFNCSDFDLNAFNSLLVKNNAICVVKPHPMAVTSNVDSLSNVIFIDENWIASCHISLYELIGASDCLISDISSVIADYMLLDRPIVLLFEDMDGYKKTRGFTFNPVADYLPAKINHNFKDFSEELRMVLQGEDQWRCKRIRLKSMFFDQCDTSSSERILNATFKNDNIT